jgi:hypothetical protein
MCAFIGACSHGTDPADTSLLQPSVITGITVTKDEYPEGTGEILGSPSDSSNTGSGVLAVPNPYTGRNYPDEPPDFDHSGRRITFEHLPAATRKVEIIHGSASSQLQKILATSGIIFSSYLTQPVRTLQSSGTEFVFRWDLKDEHGSYVTPGAYRAYYSGTGITGTHFVDVLIFSIQP